MITTSAVLPPARVSRAASVRLLLLFFMENLVGFVAVLAWVGAVRLVAAEGSPDGVHVGPAKTARAATWVAQFPEELGRYEAVVQRGTLTADEFDEIRSAAFELYSPAANHVAIWRWLFGNGPLPFVASCALVASALWLALGIGRLH